MDSSFNGILFEVKNSDQLQHLETHRLNRGFVRLKSLISTLILAMDIFLLLFRSSTTCPQAMVIHDTAL